MDLEKGCFTGFRQSELMNMLEYLKYMETCFTSALRNKSLLGDIDSLSKLETATADKLINPEFYFNFRIFDKAVSITKGGFVIINGKKVRDDHFHIKFYNFVPSSITSFGTVFDKEQFNISLGSYDTLEDTFPAFRRACLSLLTECYEVQYQELLDIY